MGYQTYLVFNNEKLPLPDTYDLSLSTIEADSSGTTEAGTYQRDVIRTGIVKISVAMATSAKWLKKLTAYSKESSLNVDYFDTYDLTVKSTTMYMTDFSAKLYKDTSYGSLWQVSFTLNEF